MDSESLRQPGRTQSWPRVRPAVWCTTTGAAVAIVTMILSAMDAISAQQAIALALPAITIILGGLIGMTVPDAWTAWRRGFRHGCEAALRSKTGTLTPQASMSARDEDSWRTGPPDADAA